MRFASLLVPWVLAVGCSSDPPASTPSADDAGGDACVPFTVGASSGATVTRAEIDTIFERSCSFSSCHGRAPGEGKLHLPPRATSDWYVEVVNVASTAHPTMKRVVPGDPQNSFLVHKLTDGLCALAKDCVGGDCGERMPQGNDALPADELEKIVEWIRNGAPET